MEALISVFHTYSAREGDKYKLCRRELKDLLQNELGEFLEFVNTARPMSSDCCLLCDITVFSKTLRR
ncbi:hypothetical protein FKM82_016345 [Ascaphus truei]